MVFHVLGDVVRCTVAVRDDGSTGGNLIGNSPGGGILVNFGKKVK